jgi:hypothetical protein
MEINLCATVARVAVTVSYSIRDRSIGKFEDTEEAVSPSRVGIILLTNISTSAAVI